MATWLSEPIKSALRLRKTTRLTALALTGVRVSPWAANMGTVARTAATDHTPAACTARDFAVSRLAWDRNRPRSKRTEVVGAASAIKNTLAGSAMNSVRRRESRKSASNSLSFAFAVQAREGG